MAMASGYACCRIVHRRLGRSVARGSPEVVMSRMSSRYPLFYDQLGCGNSDRPSDTSLWTVDRFVAELVAVRAALGLERVHLLGNSWGGMLALQYTLDRRPAPESLGSRMVTIEDASHLCFAEQWDTFHAELTDFLAEVDGRPAQPTA
ncbi:alpha/beta fold hydrolase [Nocardia elegans]|uniref:AB hydrolase-1 domain-containing protein n=3 Tax=Nocardiaceae TaxID=85025 RepID=A0A2T2Z825_9NOCA|nr:alpha/beta fold hydrolase [Nocardia elegans]PSR63901.1 hypothetical protein C8259_08510 [Nocardia nova]